MTERELRKLKRHDVLQLLLVQVQEAEQLRQQLEHTGEQLKAERELTERLKTKLNSKDAQIHKLKGRLDKKDLQIREQRATLEKLRQDRRIRMERSGSIAEAALQLSGIFEAAQSAADLYLENIRQRSEEMEAKLRKRKTVEEPSIEEPKKVAVMLPEALEDISKEEIAEKVPEKAPQEIAEEVPERVPKEGEP